MYGVTYYGNEWNFVFLSNLFYLEPFFSAEKVWCEALFGALWDLLTHADPCVRSVVPHILQVSTSGTRILFFFYMCYSAHFPGCFSVADY